MNVLRESASEGIGWSGAGYTRIIDQMTAPTKAELVKTCGLEVGFDLVGTTSAEPLDRADYYRRWLASGYAGTMGYLSRNVSIRLNPSKLLDGARSVICVGLSYHRTSETDPERGGALGSVAAYARGRDYHLVLREMLNTLALHLQERLRTTFAYRVCVDTDPVLERELARRAGLGSIGKNTCILNRQFGSHLFLGELITTLELPVDKPVADLCAHCTRCLDACPTEAFPAPYQLDATRCISYFTTEHRGVVPGEFQARMGSHVFGCDVCQEVCPYNRRAPRATHPQVTATGVSAHLDLLTLIRIRSAGHKRLTRGSATSRARPAMWRRNAAIALGNLRTANAQLSQQIDDALAAARLDEVEAVRHAAEGALRRRGQE